MKRTFTKAAAVAAIVAGAMFAVPTAASAYTPGPDAGVTDTTVTPGGTFTFFVEPEAFVAGETVSISITGENASGASLAFVKFAVETQVLGTATANAEGGLDGVQISLPANASGLYTITATSPSNPAGVSATVTAVTGNDNNDDDDLATTGADSEALLALWVGGGALLLVGGGIAVASAVRRNKQNAA